MISAQATSAALARLSAVRYFPARPEVLSDLVAMLHAQFATDDELSRGVSWLLLESGVSEWPGSYDFNQLLRRSIPRPKELSSDGKDPYAIWVQPSGWVQAPWSEEECAEVERMFPKMAKGEPS